MLRTKTSNGALSSAKNTDELNLIGNKLEHNAGGLLFPDFFDTADFAFDRLWKKSPIYSVNISDAGSSYEIELAAPGLQKEDFKVVVNRGVLTISASTSNKNEEKKKNYTRREFNYESFARSFSLPADAKEDDIKANYDNGILTLTIAKEEVPVSTAKRIAVG